jgi:hypothetical protein
MTLWSPWPVPFASKAKLPRRGIKLAPGVAERCGPCPVCGGTDRFSINVNKQVWNCRGCSTGGDVIALVQHIDGGSFMEAVETLAGPASRLAAKRQPKAAPSAPAPKKIVVARFDYCDENGTIFCFKSGASSIRIPTVPLFSARTASAKRTSHSAAPILPGQANGFTTSAIPGASSIACPSWPRL